MRSFVDPAPHRWARWRVRQRVMVKSRKVARICGNLLVSAYAGRTSHSNGVDFVRACLDEKILQRPGATRRQRPSSAAGFRSLGGSDQAATIGFRECPILAVPFLGYRGHGPLWPSDASAAASFVGNKRLTEVVDVMESLVL